MFDQVTAMLGNLPVRPHIAVLILMPDGDRKVFCTMIKSQTREFIDMFADVDYSECEAILAPDNAAGSPSLASKVA